MSKLDKFLERIFGKSIPFIEEPDEPTIDETIEYFKNFAVEHKAGLIVLVALMIVAQLLDKYL